jgi:hypothetical protein
MVGGADSYVGDSVVGASLASQTVTSAGSIVLSLAAASVSKLKNFTSGTEIGEDFKALFVGGIGSYVGEAVVGGASYGFNGISFSGAASKSRQRVRNSVGSIEFSGAATKLRTKNYTALGDILFAAAADSFRLTRGASIWEGADVIPGGSLDSGGSIWEGSTSPGGTVVSVSNNIWRSV